MKKLNSRAKPAKKLKSSPKPVRLVVGKRYVRRDGLTSGVLEKSLGHTPYWETHPFWDGSRVDGLRYSYRDDGRWGWGDNSADLVSEYHPKREKKKGKGK